jgi:hypothetical protein
MKYHQGKFKPVNPEKYAGDPTNIIYRSSWELKFMRWCDNSPNVLKYSSEETVIPYICGTDNRPHRYFVDFRIQIRAKDGSIKTHLVEVKPAGQTIPPKYPGKQTRRYITETMAFIKNQSKWKYAEEYCKDRGWIFTIITERELGI